MGFAKAANVLAVRLAAGDDGLAAAEAVHLAIEAWKYLGGVDPAWDRRGLIDTMFGGAAADAGKPTWCEKTPTGGAHAR
ncbi:MULTISPECIES: hypothetical protein [unclassified Micromonospora]|uniref:hypothetical protein n=1 Tax=unclassified Micromonospora TaxID=2617518 RepID=UPI002FF4380E